MRTIAKSVSWNRWYLTRSSTRWTETLSSHFFWWQKKTLSWKSCSGPKFSPSAEILSTRKLTPLSFKRTLSGPCSCIWTHKPSVRVSWLRAGLVPNCLNFRFMHSKLSRTWLVSCQITSKKLAVTPTWPAFCKTIQMWQEGRPPWQPSWTLHSSTYSNCRSKRATSSRLSSRSFRVRRKQARSTFVNLHSTSCQTCARSVAKTKKPSADSTASKLSKTTWSSWRWISLEMRPPTS